MASFSEDFSWWKSFICQKWLHVLLSLKVLWPPHRWFLSGHPSPESPDLCALLPAYFPSPTPISPFLQQITNSLSVFYVTVWLYFFVLYRTNHKSPDLPSQHSWSKYISQIRNNKYISKNSFSRDFVAIVQINFLPNHPS